MGASRFVGRVGGLAVALGVGAAVFSSGYGVAWASTGDEGGGQTQATGSSSSNNTSSGPARGKRGSAGKSGGAASASATRNNNRSASAATPQVNLPDSAPAGSSSGHDASVNVTVDQPDSVTVPAGNSAPAPVASHRTTVAVVPAVAVDTPDPAPAPAPAPASAITSFLSTITNTLTGGLDGNPLAPIENPLSLTLLEASRRIGAAASSTSPTASVVANAAVTQGSLTVNPTVGFLDGIVLGNLNAVSSRGEDLTYAFVGSSDGGKLTIGNVPGAGKAQSFTALPYGTWLNNTQNPTITGTQTFNVRVSEVTGFDKFLTGIPLLGMLASPIISLLQQAPLISGLLAPIIGNSVVAPISVNLDTLLSGPNAGKNVAFTYKVESFDGTLISTNFFPALDGSKVNAQNYAFTVLNGPGLGSAGVTDPFGTNQAAGSAPGLAPLRGAFSAESGFNVITWDPRGEFDSGGILQLDNPMYEGRDVSAIIDWATKNTPAVPEAPGDIAVGMIGGSYGGGIQLTTVDPRIDALVPGIAWNSLNDSLYPDQIFKTGWANTLGLALLTSGARVNNQIPLGILTGDLFGFLSQTAQAVLGSSGPGNLLTKLNIPTLFQQGTVDALFPLDQAMTNITTMLTENPFFAGPNVGLAKMIWFCGGHGVCLDPTDATAQATTIFQQDMVWLNQYVKGVNVGAGSIPTFQYWDQLGDRYVSTKLPVSNTVIPNTNFFGAPISSSADGGVLGIAPFAFLGSGPNTDQKCDVGGACAFPLNQVFATPTQFSLGVNFDSTKLTAGTKVVGAPTVSFTYQGLGTSKAVYAQVVDNKTGRVLGNIVTPIPVDLDGREHTVSVDIAEIAYTAPADASLTIQIVPSATLYWNSSFGVVNISNVSATLPTTTVPIKV